MTASVLGIGDSQCAVCWWLPMRCMLVAAHVLGIGGRPSVARYGA